MGWGKNKEKLGFGIWDITPAEAMMDKQTNEIIKHLCAFLRKENIGEEAHFAEFMGVGVLGVRSLLKPDLKEDCEHLHVLLTHQTHGEQDRAMTFWDRLDILPWLTVTRRCLRSGVRHGALPNRFQLMVFPSIQFRS
jgi:hypothetical protein